MYLANALTMADSKIYLNVPYAEKDAAKALGARWDAANKSWYIPPGKDPALFGQWQRGAAEVLAAKSPRLSNAATQPLAEFGKTTLPASKDFMPYDGETPPWD